MQMQPYERDFALRGQEVIDDTNAHTGVFYALQVVTATAVSAMTWADGYNVNTGKDWSDVGTIPAGTLLKGQFTSITLSSGTAIAYRQE